MIIRILIPVIVVLVLTDVFFDTFRKGSLTYDLEFYVTRTGEYLAGIATAQCAYAPEYVGHSGGDKVVVGE